MGACAGGEVEEEVSGEDESGGDEGGVGGSVDGELRKE